MKVAVAFDHRGVKLRERLLEELGALGHDIVDLGTDTDAVRIDYPDKAREVGVQIQSGAVERGVLDFPVVGVAKSGWGLEQFRDYAAASLKLNKMDADNIRFDALLSTIQETFGKGCVLLNAPIGQGAKFAPPRFVI